MKVGIVITGLATGGAETMLLKLLENCDKSRFSFHVFSLTGLDELAPRIRDLGIPVESLGMQRGKFELRPLIDLSRRLRDTRVELVHTWMYHADLLGGLAARAAGVQVIVWGLRNTNLDVDKSSRSTRLVVTLSALLSRWLPKGILSCSEVARDVHAARGYMASKIHVIPNGFDLSRFRPDPAARRSVRHELGLATDTPLVGLFGRYDPVKNHSGFVESAALLHRIHPKVNFVLAGSGVDRENVALRAAADAAGIADAVHTLGQRHDVPRLMASLDVLASASHGEAFPNVIGEAMACGVPCVVTDVGDSAAIVGDTGTVVRPGDMPALALALADLLAKPAIVRAGIGQRARERVQQMFEIGAVSRLYEDYYTRLAQTGS